MQSLASSAPVDKQQQQHQKLRQQATSSLQVVTPTCNQWLLPDGCNTYTCSAACTPSQGCCIISVACKPQSTGTSADIGQFKGHDHLMVPLRALSCAIRQKTFVLELAFCITYGGKMKLHLCAFPGTVSSKQFPTLQHLRRRPVVARNLS